MNDKDGCFGCQVRAKIPDFHSVIDRAVAASKSFPLDIATKSDCAARSASYESSLVQKEEKKAQFAEAEFVFMTPLYQGTAEETF